MTCPNCGNRDGAKAEVLVGRVIGRTRRDDTARFIGYKCLVCGLKYEADASRAMVDFDPPAHASPPRLR